MAQQTLQSNIKQYKDSGIKNYSLFLGGLNVTRESLKQYDPLKTGYNRIFFIKMPVFMQELLPEQTKIVRHILEYGFTSISGINGTTLNFEQMTGGYAGKSFDVASTSTDDTNEININCYEFSGSPVREYMDMWITGISDPFTGYGTYHGKISNSLPYSQANHTAEAIYVATDPTGNSNGIEYACLLSNMMPKSVKKDQFNYESGQHNIVTMETAFSCVKYESPQINDIAKRLMNKFTVLRDYLGFDSNITADDINNKAKYFQKNWKDTTTWEGDINAGAIDKP